MATPKSRFILYSGIILLAFVLFDPFNVVPSRGLRRPGVDGERAERMAQHLESVYRTPENYLIDTLEEHRLVFLGELGRIRQHAGFVASMVDALPLAGVHTLAVEFVLVEDQDVLDGLLAAEDFDRRVAADLLLRRNVLFGFAEYVDILEAVWRYNDRRPAGSEPVEVVALSQRFRYEEIVEREHLDDPERMARVISEGAPDTYMADIIREKIVDPGKKALVFIRFPHAFTTYESPDLAEQMAELGFDGVRPTGVQLRGELGDEVATVYLHGPWPDDARPAGMNYAADGYIEAMIDRVPDGIERAGFDVGADPVGTLEIRTGLYGDEENPPRFAELTDGYIILERAASLQAARIIPDFYTNENIAYARQNFPGPRDDSMDAQSLQEYLRGVVQAFDRNLQEFR